MEITSIQAKEILDCRGIPTISCAIMLDDNTYVESSVPAGTCVGKYEAKEKRDGGKRLEGLGVQNAINIINNIIGPNFIGKEPNAVQMDLEMMQFDTIEKSELGANSTLAVSMALYRAHAQLLDIELYNFIAMVSGANTVSLPIPMINIINGGAHADNNLDVQEYLLIPYAAQNVKTSIESSLEVFNKLRQLLKSNGKSTLLGLEGGFAPNFENNTEPFDFILQAITQAGFETEKFLLGIDVAASQIYDANKGLYLINNEYKNSAQMLEWYESLLKQYNLYSIEDGLQQDDLEGWIKLTKTFGNKMCIIADDIFATNPARIAKGLEYNISNSVIIKPNQIGTITETLQAIQLCKENGLSTIASHRSGETNDTFIVDLAVGASTNYIKCGGLARGERIEKYNRLLEIEHELNGLVMSE